MSCSYPNIMPRTHIPLMIHPLKEVHSELDYALGWVGHNCPTLLPDARTFRNEKMYVAVVIGRDAVKNGEVSAEELKQYGLNFQEAQKVEDLRLQWIFPGTCEQRVKWQTQQMLVIQLDKSDGSLPSCRLKAEMLARVVSGVLQKEEKRGMQTLKGIVEAFQQKTGNFIEQWQMIGALHERYQQLGDLIVGSMGAIERQVVNELMLTSLHDEIELGNQLERIRESTDRLKNAVDEFDNRFYSNINNLWHTPGIIPEGMVALQSFILENFSLATSLETLSSGREDDPRVWERAGVLCQINIQLQILKNEFSVEAAFARELQSLGESFSILNRNMQVMREVYASRGVTFNNREAVSNAMQAFNEEYQGLTHYIEDLVNEDDEKNDVLFERLSWVQTMYEEYLRIKTQFDQNN